MTHTVPIISTSNRSADVDREYVLDETTTTRRILRAKIVYNPNDPDAGVRVTIVHQRKSSTKGWEDYPTWALSRVKAGEHVKLDLGCAETKLLLGHLLELKKLQEEAGIPWGSTEVVVGTSEEVVLADPIRAEAMRRLLATNQTEEVWEALVEHAPEALTRLCLGRVQQERVEVLERFRTMLHEELLEGDWQTFFEANTWIFGYGLNYRFLTPIQNQPQYGGIRFDGRGGQRGDGLLASESEGMRFTVLVEIKRPDTDLFENSAYRNGAWQLGSELVGATSQLQTNCQSWQRSAEAPENLRRLDRQRVLTREPKGILVIGHTSQFSVGNDDDLVKAQTFESFRRNLHNPEILTFDEVFKRAEFIVNHGRTHQQDRATGAAAVPDPDPFEVTDDLPF